MDERRSPLLSQLVLWGLYALLVAASVVTVLVPELSDRSDDGEAEQAEAARSE